MPKNTSRRSRARSEQPLKAATKLTFFIGKGGVGKTTCSAAYALALAALRNKPRVALVSTDPAHSLADVLEVKLGPGLHKLKLGTSRSLTVSQVDPRGRFEQFVDEYREAITQLVEQGTFLSRKEVDAFLESALPGLAEVSALLTLEDLLESGDYDEVVVDTAPIGHTLQLFRIPEQLARFVEFLELAGQRDEVLAAHFGGRVQREQSPVLREWQRTLDALRAALSRENARIVMVTSPERFSLEEAKRTSAQLQQESDARVTDIVINRAIVGAGRCPRCSARAKLTKNAEAFVKRTFSCAPIYIGADPGMPLLGIRTLTAFGAHVFGGRALRLKIAAPRLTRKLSTQPASWPSDAKRLTFTLGKGGVGKTTVSAGIAFTIRSEHPKHPVLICSTDPAPSLDDVFEQDVSDEPKAVLGDRDFRACEIDASAEFRRWTAKLKSQLSRSLEMQTGGLHLELSFEHQMLSALLDIVPPGVDEIFAIFKVLDLLAAKGQSVCIDMAPTGHALELLRTPDRLLVWSRLLLKSLAAHRGLPLAQELGVEVATVSHRTRELLELMRNKKESRLFAVMLAEPLPDRETGRLLKELAELKLEPAALFVNRLLLLDDLKGCRRCASAQRWQAATLSKLQNGYSGRLYGIRNFPAEISGKSGLQRLTRELWLIEQR